MTTTLPESVLTKHQKKLFTKTMHIDGVETNIIVEVRYDDECRNGHNTFAITADVKEQRGNGRWVQTGGGCCHELIAKQFPDLAKYIKWHLFDSTGPMHYIANTVYLAGNRDHNGKLKGEPSGYKEKVYVKGLPQGLPIAIDVEEYKYFLAGSHDNTIFEIPHKIEKDGYKFSPKYSFRHCQWHEAGFDTRAEAEACLELFKAGRCYLLVTPTGYSQGKERELDAARNAAVWPEATRLHVLTRSNK
jgi:hypothetical protein